MDALTAVTAIVSVSGISAASVYGWTRSHALVVPKHPVGKLITSGNLSFVDVQEGLKKLEEEARDFGPDAIYAINRGGAIIGGMLAKRLNLFPLGLISVNFDLPAAERLIVHCDPVSGKGKILLIDDAKRKGEHMRAAHDYLLDEKPGSDIRRAVMLELISKQHNGPEHKAFHHHGADFVAFPTSNPAVGLPWDPGA